MNLFDRWQRRHLAADPMEPASPPPFQPRDRVVVSAPHMDGFFTHGHHGIVVDVEFTTDDNDPFGPWIIFVVLDGDPARQRFHAAELTRETEPPAPVEPPTITVTQPEDDDEPVPYVPTDGGGQHWIQCAKELRHETTPLYDDVAASAMARDGLAAEVEAYLADVAAGGAA